MDEGAHAGKFLQRCIWSLAYKKRTKVPIMRGSPSPPSDSAGEHENTGGNDDKGGAYWSLLRIIPILASEMLMMKSPIFSSSLTRSI